MNYNFVIGIITCDKDLKYIKDLLLNIGHKVSGNYHIIIYNNCVENYDMVSNLDINAIILPNTYKHKNARQLYARKMITEKAYELGSDYIWFIDADDTVLDVNFDKLDNYTDIIVFPYDTEDSKAFMDTKLEPGILECKPTYDNFLDVGCPLWRKFIKTEILKKSYDMIDAYNLPPVSCSEDTIVSLLSLKFAKTYSKHHETLYFNHRMRGDSNNTVVTFDKVVNFTTGINEIFKITETCFTTEEQESLKLKQIRKNTIWWILSRICLIDDEIEIQKSMDFINSILDEKYQDEYNEDNV